MSSKPDPALASSTCGLRSSHRPGDHRAEPGLMQADLARTLAIEEPFQAVIFLNRLESRGLAVPIRCNPDKRSYGIFLSETGETLLKELRGGCAERPGCHRDAR